MTPAEEIAKKSILDLNLTEAEQLLVGMGLPNYRAKQVFSWIYEKHVVQWDEMSNLPLPLRKELSSTWTIMTSQVAETLESQDGTTKLLIGLHDGRAIESVWIPEEERSTVCLSTQVGCPVGCAFCASGKHGLRRNLSSGEILEQILHIAAKIPPGQDLRNVVLMGMGEPMRNYENVMRAVRAMNAPWGFHVGARKITVSTIGDVKGIKRLAEEGLQVNLAISLHAPDEKTRRQIVPPVKVDPLAKILEAARAYFDRTGRKVTFEYVLLDGVNSSVPQARQLARLLRGFPCYVNLIPFNAVEGTALKPPDRRAVRLFQHELQSLGVQSAIRARRGTDIAAACGQLAGEASSK
jgi:23S rRNA (adenine2503-C2)-methyltransferase